MKWNAVSHKNPVLRTKLRRLPKWQNVVGKRRRSEEGLNPVKKWNRF